MTTQFWLETTDTLNDINTKQYDINHSKIQAIKYLQIIKNIESSIISKKRFGL